MDSFVSESALIFKQFQTDIREAIQAYCPELHQQEKRLYKISAMCQRLYSAQGLISPTNIKTEEDMLEVSYKTPLGPLHLIPSITVTGGYLFEAIKKIEKATGRKIITTGIITASWAAEKERRRAFLLLEVPLKEEKTAIWYFAYAKMKIMNVYRLTRQYGEILPGGHFTGTSEMSGIKSNKIEFKYDIFFKK